MHYNSCTIEMGSYKGGLRGHEAHCQEELQKNDGMTMTYASTMISSKQGCPLHDITSSASLFPLTSLTPLSPGPPTPKGKIIYFESIDIEKFHKGQCRKGISNFSAKIFR